MEDWVDGQPEDSDSYVNRIDIIFIKILNSAFIFFYLTFFILELLIFMFFYRMNRNQGKGFFYLWYIFDIFTYVDFKNSSCRSY